MTMTPTQYRDIAMDAARQAGAIVMGFYKGEVNAWEKNPGNPVTEADLAADAFLKEFLLERVPQAGWLSEETKDDKSRLERNLVWVVDPIDGTKEFVQGVPQFAVCVALVEAGTPIAAAMYNPVEDEMFDAALNAGARLNDAPLKVRDTQEWNGATLCVSRSELKRGEWAPYTEQQIEGVGSIAYKMALVAAGRYDATFSRGPKNEWDVCAGALIATEAGGWSGGLSGTPYAFNQPDPLVDGVVATTPALLSPILESVAQLGRVRQGERT